MQNFSHCLETKPNRILREFFFLEMTAPRLKWEKKSDVFFKKWIQTVYHLIEAQSSDKTTITDSRESVVGYIITKNSNGNFTKESCFSLIRLLLP